MSGHGDVVGGTQTYTTSLGRELEMLGETVSVLGIGPPVDAGRLHFVSIAAEPIRSNIEFHRRLRAWARKGEMESDAVVDAQRPDFLAPFLGQANGAALVCTLHGDPLNAVHSSRPLIWHAYRRIERSSLAAARRVISASRSAMELYKRRYPFLSTKISSIPIGVNLQLFGPRNREHERARLNLPSGQILLYAGRLETEKRVEVLFDAVAMMSHPPFVLVAGSGSLESRLRRKAIGLPVRFLGKVPHTEIPHIISAANALVLPSAFEGLPTIAVEAMACGVPVIATPVGDLPRIVKNGRTGYLFDGRPETLKNVLEANLQGLGGLTQDCVTTAGQFGWENIARQVLEVLRAAAN